MLHTDLTHSIHGLCWQWVLLAWYTKEHRGSSQNTAMKGVIALDLHLERVLEVQEHHYAEDCPEASHSVYREDTPVMSAARICIERHALLIFR